MLGVVPYNMAFTGFGDDIVIIVASALVVSAAVERSGVVEAALHVFSPRISSVRGQLVLLVATVTVTLEVVDGLPQGVLAVTVYVVVLFGDAVTEEPVVALSPVAGLHVYDVAPVAVNVVD